jgi:hypothetical protein
MRFEFAAAPTGGIRLIPEIPDQRLCRLEGLNGIGKTLAIRLLELSTGQQPYAGMPLAWRSLRALGPCSIKVTGLDSHQTLVIVLTPDRWTDDPAVPGVLGHASLDGVDIPFDSVPKILSVVRIAGDQTMVTQIEERIRADSRLAQSIASVTETRLHGLEQLSSRLLDTVRPFSRAAYRQVVDATADAAARRDEGHAEVTVAADRGRSLSELAALEQARARLTERAPQLETEIAGADESIAAFDLQRLGLTRRRDELLPVAQAAEGVIRQIRRLSRLQERQAEHARQSQDQVESLAQSLSVSADIASVVLATSEVQSQILDLSNRRKSFAVLPELDALLRRIEAAVDESPQGLPETEIVVVLGSAKLSVADLRNGLHARRQELAKLQAFAALSEIDAELADLRQRKQRLSQLSALLTESRRLSGGLRRTEERLRESFQRAREDASEQYGAIIRDLEELEKNRLEVIELRATLRYSLGLLQAHGSADELDAEIAARRREFQVTGATQEAVAATSNALEEARRKAAEAEETASAAASAHAQFTRRLKDAIAILVGDPPLRRILEKAAVHLPSEDSPDDAYLAVFERLAQALERLQVGTDTVVIAGGALKGNLDTLAGMVGKSVGEVGDSLDRLAKHYEAIFGELLSRDEMQHALFNGGSFDSLDLLSGEVAWKSASGDLRRRPLEAFSSGESAFAYVLASAISKTNPQARNRLLVLDEFGAFIEAGKMQDLIAFLSRDVLDAGRADQVVVILPLRDVAQAGELGDRGYMSVEERPA